MKTVSGKQMCETLKRQGWVLQRIRGSHHIYALPGRPGVVAVPVHGKHYLRTGTQRSIMRQAGLTDDDL